MDNDLHRCERDTSMDRLTKRSLEPSRDSRAHVLWTCRSERFSKEPRIWPFREKRVRSEDLLKISPGLVHGSKLLCL